MANRNFHRVQSLTREVKSLFANVAIGASGVATINKNLSVGITSISRDSAGVYSIILDDKYNNLLSVSVMQVQATAEDLTFQVESESVSGSKEIKIQCQQQQLKQILLTEAFS